MKKITLILFSVVLLATLISCLGGGLNPVPAPAAATPGATPLPPATGAFAGQTDGTMVSTISGWSVL